MFRALAFWQYRSIRVWRLLVALLLVLGAAGCNDPNAVRVQLATRSPSKAPYNRLELQAQVAGAQEGLLYKWFSVSGACDPQQSGAPVTTFTFADGASRDRVSVEIWRDNKRIAQSEIAVKFDESRARLEREKLPEASIEITAIPPYETGGPDTRANISGKVQGVTGSNYVVLVYARAYDNWHIQPVAYASHRVQADGTWATWTHTGTSYAALLVRSEFEPLVRLDVLPQAGGYVIARTIVDGVRK